MTARTDLGEPRRAMVEEAARWHVQLGDESCSDLDRDAFEVWLAADDMHRLAFERMSAIGDRFAGQDAVERFALRKMLGSRRSRGAMTLVGLFFVGACSAVWFLHDNPLVRAPIAGERSVVGELRSTRLATGDSVTLDSDSAVDLDETDRTVQLWRGGVMAKVRPGLEAPFLVRTPQGSARALGTQFSVRIVGEATIVRVVESKVEACAKRTPQACLVLTAGQAARLDGSGVHRLADVDPGAEAAWSDGLLVADDRPLAEVLDALNRYRAAPIAYSPEDLEGLHVTGTFPLTDGERALASIAAALPVTVEHADGRISLRRH